MNATRAVLQIVATVLMLIPWGPANANVTNDRWYRLGEDAGENAVIGSVVGAASTPVNGITRDSHGPTGAFLHLTVNGAPTYTSTTDRAGAGVGAIGASFLRTSASSGDYLRSPISLNAPSNMWDSDNFFPPSGPQFSQNYEGIYGRGIQTWLKPSAATQNVLQDVVVDTMEHGIYIAGSNRWGLIYHGFRIESNDSVAYGSWSHVMEVAGFNDPDDGRSNVGAALLVNGIAVATSRAVNGDVIVNSYNPSIETALLVGSSIDSTGNFYHGIVDELRLFLWGNNSRQTNNGAGPNGKDWGNLSLGQDNEWIARQLSTLGVTNIADVNLDGSVNNSDVSAFIAEFGKVRTVNGLQVGDWLSRQDGDLNYDGATDLADAFILHNGLLGAGSAAGLDFNLLSHGQVPEPSTTLLLLVAVMGSSFRRRVR